MSKQIIETKDAPAPIGPYSQAVRSGNLLFVSGQIALNPQTQQLELDNIEHETHRVMNNLHAILKQAGADFSKVIKTSIFLKNMDDFSAVNTVYGSYFISHFPARETVQVARLPKDVNVEISVVAEL